jgi:DNA-binding transcriptional ArsR family regulator
MTAEDEDRLWAALGDPMRLRVLDLLLERGEATASGLAEALPITRQGVAKHLAVLERAGLVAARRAGREVRFALREERLDQARRQMARVAARWDDRLVAIKAMAEAASPPAPRRRR